MSSYNHDLTGKMLGYGCYKLNRCIKWSKMSSVYQGIDLILQHPAKTPTPTQQAIDTVIRYYDTWNKRDYTGAYSLLGLVYQKAHPYSSLLASYESTLHSSVTINGTTGLSNGAFKVMITDSAIEKNSPGMQTVNRVYHGYFIVKEENGSLKLTPTFNY